MKTIGISLESFMDWGGGIDFIRNLTLALHSTAKSHDYKIVFLNSEYKYNRLIGAKRKIVKYSELFIHDFLNLNRSYKPGSFRDFSGIRYYHYKNQKDLLKIIEKQNITTLLLAVNDSFGHLNIPVFCYLFDCQHKYYPELFTIQEIKNRDSYFTSMLSTYSKFLVNANSVKSDLISFYDAKPDQIFVLPFTPKLNISYLNDNSDLIRKYNLPERFFIISNQYWIHKNHETAFRAFAELIRNDVYKDVRLICTGKMEDYRKPEYIEYLQLLIHELGLENKIINLGFIPKTEQIEIMKNAKALIQPTLFEGGPGGGSVWDALSLGVPVIMSDIITNKEIKHELACFFKAKSPDSLTGKMQEVLNTRYVRLNFNELVSNSEKNIQVLGDYLYSII